MLRSLALVLACSHSAPALGGSTTGALQPSRLADAVLLGDCDRAIELLPATPSPAEHLVAAHCHLALGHAAAVLEVPAVTGPLAPYGSWYRAQALHTLGRDPDAAKELAGLDLPGDVGLRAKLLRGITARDAEALRALSGTAVGREARYELAMLSSGADREASLLALWAEAVAPWDDVAKTALSGPLPTVTDTAGRKLIRQRFDALRKLNRHEEALPLLESLHATAPPTTPEARLEHARALFAARVWDRAPAAWKAALGEPGQATGSPSDLFDYALTFARAGDYDTAAVVYRRLIAAHPTHEKADFASFKLGYMEYDRGDCAKAVPLLREHAGKRPDSKHLDEARWFEARCHWNEGDLDAAETAWKALKTERPKSSLVPGAAYWLAKLAGRRGDLAAEQKGLAAVVSSWPTSGYAWFASLETGKAFPAKPPAEPPAFPTSLAADPHVRRAEDLLDVGLRPLARAELAAVKAEGREASLALAWARIDAGDYRGGQALAKPYCVSPWQGGDPIAQQACWPRPERALVEQVVAMHPLPKLLPYAIMSAESALDASVTSAAGARGLMQLMPAVAERLHGTVFSDGRFDDERLYWGPYNATLGSWELGERATSLNGVLAGSDLPAVIASYNGGEEAVRRWVADEPKPPEPDVFAEDVGYVETRKYVKRVLGELMAWRWVYGD